MCWVGFFCFVFTGTLSFPHPSLFCNKVNVVFATDQIYSVARHCSQNKALQKAGIMRYACSASVLQQKDCWAGNKNTRVNRVHLCVTWPCSRKSCGFCQRKLVEQAEQQRSRHISEISGMKLQKKLKLLTSYRAILNPSSHDLK